MPVEEIQRGIRSGVRKVNIDTDIRLAMTGAMRRVIAEQSAEFDPRKTLAEARKAARGRNRAGTSVSEASGWVPFASEQTGITRSRSIEWWSRRARGGPPTQPILPTEIQCVTATILAEIQALSIAFVHHHGTSGAHPDDVFDFRKQSNGTFKYNAI